jgi:hypothetical protein
MWPAISGPNTTADRDKNPQASKDIRWKKANRLTHWVDRSGSAADRGQRREDAGTILGKYPDAAIAICALCSCRQPGSYWSGSGQSIGTAMGSEPSLGAKMLELLKEFAPHVARVAICPTQMLTRPVGSLRRWLRLRGLRSKW